MRGKEERFVKWFSELNNKDIGIAGGKGASLAEMYNAKFPIPPGFVVTAQAYGYFIEKSGLKEKIAEVLSSFDIENTEQLNFASRRIRELIENSSMPGEMEEEIIDSYEALDVSRKDYANASKSALDILKNSKESVFVAVRSSATTEDLADASFAGQQDSFLNVKGKNELIKKVKECFSSLFTARAIYYRQKKGFAHDKSLLSVVIQKMINSEKSGVIFSKNPIKEDNSIMIEAVFGLGEGIVSGRIKPDNYIIDRDLDNFNIKDINVANKKIAITRDSSGENKIVKLTEEKSNSQVLNNYELKTLSQYALRLEEHYRKPQDIEFAIGEKEIYIVQSRPITTLAKNMGKESEIGGDPILRGLGASPGVASGKVKIIHNISELEKVEKGDILVTEMTNPDMVVSMQKAAAIVTDEGGQTSHAAIISREMGIVCVVGTEKATKKLKDGMIITVDGSNGKIYEGKGEEKKAEILPIIKTRTKIKVIVDLPDYADRAVLSGCNAVGLTRLEGIIAESGKHPLYFVKNGKIEDYEKIIHKGIKKIAEKFDEVWVRTSDIRSDEFGNLEGAPNVKEGNPMLGNHGVRFSLKNREIIRAEISALNDVAKNFKDKTLGIMVPQVISLEEVKETKVIANEIGLMKNVKIGIMVETPAAVMIIENLVSEGLDFISFGTNDLTQYTLAIDRNNQEIQNLYNEMNPAVLNSIKKVILACKGKTETSICGQAGSREEMVKFLVENGIDSITANADAAYNVSKIVSQVESLGDSSGGKASPQEKNKSDNYNKSENKIQDVRYKWSEKNIKNKNNRIKRLNREFGMIEGIPVLQEGILDNLFGSEISNIGGTNQDIEEVILKELEKDEGGEYNSNIKERKADIPKLNDSMSVEF